MKLSVSSAMSGNRLGVQELQRVMKPLAKAATLLPPAAFRADPLVALTAFGRYIPYLLQVCT